MDYKLAFQREDGMELGRHVLATAWSAKKPIAKQRHEEYFRMQKIEARLRVQAQRSQLEASRQRIADRIVKRASNRRREARIQSYETYQLLRARAKCARRRGPESTAEKERAIYQIEESSRQLGSWSAMYRLRQRLLSLAQMDAATHAETGTRGNERLEGLSEEENAYHKSLYWQPDKTSFEDVVVLRPMSRSEVPSRQALDTMPETRRHVAEGSDMKLQDAGKDSGFLRDSSQSAADGSENRALCSPSAAPSIRTDCSEVISRVARVPNCSAEAAPLQFPPIPVGASPWHTPRAGARQHTDHASPCISPRAAYHGLGTNATGVTQYRVFDRKTTQPGASASTSKADPGTVQALLVNEISRTKQQLGDRIGGIARSRIAQAASSGSSATVARNTPAEASRLPTLGVPTHQGSVYTYSSPTYKSGFRTCGESTTGQSVDSGFPAARSRGGWSVPSKKRAFHSPSKTRAGSAFDESYLERPVRLALTEEQRVVLARMQETEDAGFVRRLCRLALVRDASTQRKSPPGRLADGFSAKASPFVQARYRQLAAWTGRQSDVKPPALVASAATPQVRVAVPSKPLSMPADHLRRVTKNGSTKGTTSGCLASPGGQTRRTAATKGLIGKPIPRFVVPDTKARKIGYKYKMLGIYSPMQRAATQLLADAGHEVVGASSYVSSVISPLTAILGTNRTLDGYKPNSELYALTMG